MLSEMAATGLMVPPPVTMAKSTLDTRPIEVKLSRARDAVYGVSD
jgi:hypothetical protein